MQQCTIVRVLLLLLGLTAPAPKPAHHIHHKEVEDTESYQGAWPAGDYTRYPPAGWVGEGRHELPPDRDPDVPSQPSAPPEVRK